MLCGGIGGRALNMTSSLSPHLVCFIASPAAAMKEAAVCCNGYAACCQINEKPGFGGD